MNRTWSFQFARIGAVLVPLALSTGAADEKEIRVDSHQITESDRQWWAFQPVKKPPVPVTAHSDWSVNPIDHFVYRRLAERGLHPAEQADDVTLVRRLYYDLIGLPPTPEEVDAYVNDDSENAWVNLIDRLLADARYGEHWARYWLDVVRYSESDGWNQDAYRPDIWRYRDYVVGSFNKDRPYPRFVREQLAGDEMPGDNPEQLLATGFLRLGIYEYNQRDATSLWNDIMNEITDVTGDVFLGMGIACARCHDHKFDPVPQTDYFKLRSFFEPIIWRDDLHYATEAQQAAHQTTLAVWENATQDIRARIDALIAPYYDRKWKSTVDKFPLDIQACFNKPVSDRTSWEHQMAYLVSRQFLEEGGGPLNNMKKEDKEKYDSLNEELAAFDHLKPDPLPQLMTATDFSGPISPTVIPGDRKQTPIQPGYLSVLQQTLAPARLNSQPRARSSGRRTALARWIGRADNPLTTRVIVNRIWQQHFGRGIVSTPNDFGRLGQLPTHPDLLDWLTSSFVENGWHFKWLHKQILMSATWRQSASHPREAECQQQDPGEKLIWRARIRRLSAEQIRDAMLSASGELDSTLGGPSVAADSPRRALYVKSFRNTPSKFLHAFDAANGLKSVAERNTTTTPTQSLLLFNGDFLLGRAQHLSERLVQQGFETSETLLTHAFRLLWGRMPHETELADGLSFLGNSSDDPCLSIDTERLEDFCHVLLNSNEFLYVD